MDKYEYKLRAEEINSLIDQKKFGEAVKIADTIDWRRVKSVSMLCKVSELYKYTRRYEDSRDVLLLADARFPDNRKIIYSLCELSIKLEDVVNALEYYKKFSMISSKDPIKYILQYKLYEAQDVSLDERIQVLEEYKKRDYREKWGYELAYLYHRLGLRTKCIEECDELILWFGEGRYVIKAMELKMLHAPLTDAQQEKYNEYMGIEGVTYQGGVPNVVTKSEKVEEPISTPTPAYMDEQVETQNEAMPVSPLDEPVYSSVSMDTIPSMPIQIKAVEVSHAPTTRIPAKKVDRKAEELAALAAEAARRSAELQEPVVEELYNEVPAEEPQVEESYPEQETVVTGDTQSLVSTEVFYSEEEPVAEGEDVQDVETAEEPVAEEIEPAENVTIDLPEIPLATPEEVDIEVQPLGVGKFDTINLQNELARNLAEFMQKEDMEASDATRALPIDSIQSLAEIENPEEVILAAMNQASQAEEPAAEETSDDAQEATKDLSNMPVDTVITKSVVEEVRRVLGDDNQDTITEEDFLRSMEEAKAIEEAATVEIPSNLVEEAVAVEEEPVAEDIPVVEEAPVAEETPVEEEAPVIEETPAVEEAPVIEETSETIYTENTVPISVDAEILESVTPAPVVEETSVEEVSVAEETPVVEEAPAVEETPVAEETLVVEEAPVVKEEPVEEKTETVTVTPVTPVVPVTPVTPVVPVTPVIPVAKPIGGAGAVAIPTVGLPVLKQAAEIFNKPVEELTEEEKQITGQLCFADILAEWETVKKTEDEALIEEMRQRVMAQTGPIVKTDIVEALENSAPDQDMKPATFESQVLPEVNPIIQTPVEAPAPAVTSVPVMEDALTEEDEVEELVEIEDISFSAPLPVENISENLKPEPIKPETHEIEFDTSELKSLVEKLETSVNLDEEPEEVEPIHLDQSIVDEIDAKKLKEDTPINMPVIEAASIDETPISAPINLEQASEPRLLDKDEKALFGSFARTKKMQEEIANVIDNMSMNPATGNVIITAENGIDVNGLVTNLVNLWAKRHPGQVKKSARVNPETLNEKDVKESLKKIPNGILVVNHAGLLNDFALVPMGDYLSETKEPGVIFILIDTKKEIDKIWEYDSMPKDNFNLRIDISALDNDSLVNYGKEYALEQEYSIDEMGVLALYTRISERQTNEHAVTVDEVKEIVDEAIERAEKKSVSYFMDVIFSKRYDEEDMVVLREKDFLG